MLYRRDSGHVACAVAVVIGVAVWGARPTLATIRYVPGNYPTIQDAIDACHDGDVVEVAPGTYYEMIVVDGKEITVRSSDGPEVTTIDAQENGRVVVFKNIWSTNCALQGFTITGGLNNSGNGSGMFIDNSSPTVSNCVFLENTGGSGACGGGIFAAGDNRTTVIGCTFIGNYAYNGGAMHASDEAIITGCIFAENDAYGYGGGIFLDHGELKMVNSTITGNHTNHDGGGLYLESGSHDVLLLSCTVADNDARFGGGIYAEQLVSPTLIGCVFGENTASLAGGGMYSIRSTAQVVNCTFSGNTASVLGGAMFNDDFSAVTVVSSILWGDSPDEIYDSDSLSLVMYTDIEGGWYHTGFQNNDLDPMFVAPADGDLRLLPDSPCIDNGGNNALPADSLDLDDDGDTAERIPLDLDGNPRFADDPNNNNTGCGLPVIVDMGAYEFAGNVWHPMRIGDIDGDGNVGTADLLALLGAWGGYEDPCVLADLDLNWEVNTADLLLLLANWG